MLTAGSKIVKYLLFIFNFVFVLTGIALIVIGIIVKSPDWQGIDKITSENYVQAPNVLIFIGCFVFVVAFFGCCGALQENHCMIVTFSVIMMAIFIAEVAIGVTGYMMKSEATDLLVEGLNKTMMNYNETSKNADTEIWDNIQEQFKCCGVKSYKDWDAIHKPLPHSCCEPVLNGTKTLPCTPSSPTLHKAACLTVVSEEVKQNASTIGFTGLFIAAIQLIGVIFSCRLAYSIRNDYESV